MLLYPGPVKRLSVRNAQVELRLENALSAYSREFEARLPYRRQGDQHLEASVEEARLRRANLAVRLNPTNDLKGSL
jgi:hypothetical protein